ncbi:alkaline phosphatase family protein [bacterium]|nr:alkaline phosphatase family protein [bacterium]
MTSLHSGRRIALLLAALAAVTAGCGPDAPPTLAERATPGPVFLLGFDGLTPELVERFEGEGLLPNFARLRERGAVGRVRSTVPMISPPAWATASTGALPGDHGIWGFWLPEGDDPRGRFVDATRRLAPAIWETLSEAGRTVGVVNVPITCPPDDVNGFMIAGFPYPEGAPLTYPGELEAEITERGYERDAWLGPPDPGAELDWLRAMRRKGDARRKIALELLFERRPDFSFVVFTTPDRIQHHLWKFFDSSHPLYREGAEDELKNAIRDVYVWCDDILGEVLDELPAHGTLLVVADHGFGPAYAGISKAAVMERAGADGAAPASRAIFGGDFYLPGADSTARARFAEELRELTGPDGKPLVATVYETALDTKVRGYGRDLGPDVVADEAEGYLFAPGAPGGPLIGPLPPKAFSGWHRRHGYFAAWGPPIETGPVRDCALGDIPAIAMHLLGEPIPRRYQQNLPRNLFPNAFFVERPMRYSGEPTEGLRRPGERPAEKIDDALREQLRALGYVQ